MSFNPKKVKKPERKPTFTELYLNGTTCITPGCKEPALVDRSNGWLCFFCDRSLYKTERNEETNENHI